MIPTNDSPYLVLTPFNPREAISVNIAASRAGKSPRTIRLWCEQHGIGRRVAGGPWMVSAVALAMLLDGDAIALASYLSGDRDSDVVAAYFQRLGIPRRINGWRYVAQ